MATEKDPLEKEKCDHNNSGPTSTPARGRMAAARGRVAATCGRVAATCGRVAAACGRVAAAPTSCRLLSDRRTLLAEAFYK